MKDLEVSLEFLDFPPAHTCSGENSSPKITIKGLDCTSVAIIVYNPSIRNCYSFASWVIWNIPAQQVIPAGIPHGKIVTSPVSAMQGTNDAGIIGYTGPCPTVGEMHRYLFRVYGLDDLIELSGGSTKYQLNALMHDHIIQYGETEGAYGRQVFPAFFSITLNTQRGRFTGKMPRSRKNRRLSPVSTPPFAP